MTISLYRHKASNALYEAFPPENGRVRFWTQGGGFEKSLPEEKFAEEFEVFTQKVEVRAGTVTADFLPEGVTLPCYSDGMRWNGWGCPMFDEDTIRRFIKISDDPSITFREEDKTIIYHCNGSDDPEIQEIKAQPVKVGDRILMLYENTAHSCHRHHSTRAAARGR